MRSEMSGSGLIGVLGEDLLQILSSCAMPFVHVDSPTGSMEHWQLTHTISKQMDLVGL